MSASPRRHWTAMTASWNALTAAGRRRIRDQRLVAFRRFGQAQGWSVLGLHQDLSVRYPVAPLLGADSAQTELALAGTWQQWSALVASVRVCHRGATALGQRDAIVQLTILDSGPSVQFTATWHPGGPEVVLLTRSEPALVAEVEQLLRAAARLGRLLPDDHVATDELEMIHTRPVDARHVLDLIGPVALLADLAVALDQIHPS